MKSALATDLPTSGAEVFGAGGIPIRYHYPRMKSVIVGTAGHIDHGKTALVKALTGIDADRLEEEKRRGITIDLGFAHRDLPGPNGEILRLGFVDVPGHERFIRNMLAGVGGIDLVLLVIAADEGIKPQTREHLDICQLLAVRRGIVVLTKADMVDRETLSVVRMEVEEFLRGSFLAGRKARIIPVSAMTGAGLDHLTQALVDAASTIEPKDAKTLARLPIDRVFSMKGFGTVVTGTLVSGAIRRDDELEVFPKGQRVRVRGVQVHGETANEAIAGQRTALNLAGIATEDLQRGMTLAPHSTFHATWRADVTLSLLASAKALKDRSRVHLHSYTSETVAEVVLYGQKQIAPGQTSLAQLRLAETTLLLPGDRFIIRQFSPVVTIGGGVVLDAAPLENKIRTEDKILFLEKMDKGSPEEILLARIARRGTAGLAIEAAVAETGWTLERVQSIAASLLAKSAVVRTNGHYLSAAAFSSMASEAVVAVKAFHNYNPLVAGISREALRERLDLSPQVFAVILEALVRDQQIEVAGDQVRAAGRGVVLRDEEAESKKMIETAFASAGLKVPALKEVLAGLKVDRVRAQKIVTLLLRDKILVKLSDDLVFHSDALAELRQRLQAHKAKSPKIDVAAFKELTGVSRKYAIPLLEYLDREHVTRRVGDERVIL
ncbi:MAG: selenocysteine-specific translation elongation factor [Acidobacteriia bacterium]|nr:selenocysteine-specific translation elongation factor [Terriglobia bacterium]